MRDKLPVHTPARTGHPEPKHITAKPEGKMSFADSGEVSVNAPAALNAKVEAPEVQLPVTGQNVAELKQMSPSSAPATTPPLAAGTGVARGAVGGVAAGGAVGANAYSSAADLSDLVAKKDSALHGSVNGRVFDASGAVVPNAKITALGPLGSRTVTADGAGKYSLDHLAVGNYQFQFNALGFRETQLQQVAVLANTPVNVDAKLAPGATAEVVSVEAATPEVNQQAHQQIALQSDEQQSANQIQSQELEVESAPIKVQKATKSKSATRAAAQPVPALARAVSAPVWQWSLSPQGVVQRSVDSGKSWQPVSVATAPTFRAISSLLNHIWVGGKGGVLYHSADAGQHWVHVVPAHGEEKLHDDITEIQIVDPQSVVLTTSSSETWVTADSGQSWSRK
jgi:hypothetical protein